GAAAKAIEAERAQRAAETETHFTGGVSTATKLSGAEGGTFRMTCSEPERETEKVDKLYQALLNAKQQDGEKVRELTPESFASFVKKKTKDLQQQKNCSEVEYVVEIVGGQAKLKALVKA